MNFLLIFLLGIPSIAAKPQANFLPSCEPSGISSSNKVEMAGGLKDVPKGLLVAREAYFEIESHDASLRIRSYQSFFKSKPSSRILCGSSDAPISTRFSMMAPTLIDAKTGRRNTFWQFQVLAQESVLSPWNTRSVALQSYPDVTKMAEKLGYEVRVFRISHNKFEVNYRQKSVDKIQTLSVVYDLD